MDPEQQLRELHADLHLQPDTFDSFRALVELFTVGVYGPQWRIQSPRGQSLADPALTFLETYGGALWPFSIEKRSHLTPSSRKSREGYWGWNVKTAGFEGPVLLVDGRRMEITVVAKPRTALNMFFFQYRRVFAAAFPRLKGLQIRGLLAEGWKAASLDEKRRFHALSDEEKRRHREGLEVRQRQPHGGLTADSGLARVVIGYMMTLMRCPAGAVEDTAEQLMKNILGCDSEEVRQEPPRDATVAQDTSQNRAADSVSTTSDAITAEAGEWQKLELTLSALKQKELFLAWFKEATGGLGGLPVVRPTDFEKMMGSRAELLR
ncbi:hypothetical protein LTR36_003047 [Oleoguttula mirabilis]|uniref:HMG box domain-containing protein n=1 Tax=Oleoguttula mirabilis TaxID=1507867 RepID=A0AAV9JX02_9PEZI|nr:hypothetical protein LTR36_003047 [Oleoguttula mirabilis]